MEFGDGHDCDIFFPNRGRYYCKWFSDPTGPIGDLSDLAAHPARQEQSDGRNEQRSDPSTDPVGGRTAAGGLRGAAPPGRGADQPAPPGQTLQPTALVHEAYLRLVGNQDPGWEGRRHFFGAAARAMREILIEQARRKGSRKHGGGARRVELSEGLALIEPPADDLLALDEAIQQLQAEQPHLAEVVLLRYYTGLSVEETADVVGRSASTVTRDWRFARAWLAGRVWAKTRLPARSGGAGRMS